jgi:hypothetical protein
LKKPWQQQWLKMQQLCSGPLTLLICSIGNCHLQVLKYYIMESKGYWSCILTMVTLHFSIISPKNSSVAHVYCLKPRQTVWTSLLGAIKPPLIGIRPVGPVATSTLLTTFYQDRASPHASKYRIQ